MQYDEAMKGLVTCGYAGELFLFDAAGPGKKLHGLSKRDLSVSTTHAELDQIKREPVMRGSNPVHLA